MTKPAYRAARWTYQVSDLKTGKVLTANRPAELVFTGSTAKLFTVGTTYGVLGAQTRLTTPVYATGSVEHGALSGNLVLVASGDLTLGGRNAMAGRDDSSFTKTTSDHVYGDIAPNAVTPPGKPLAGLDSLARQVRAHGIRRVDGDVLVDARLWKTAAGHEGVVPPIFVNDNLLDLTVTPGQVGTTATVAASPATAAFRTSSHVRTVAGADADLHVAADPTDPHLLLLTGTIGDKAGPRLTVYRIPDAASWARTLFIEALTRAGVTVGAAPLATNPAGKLPRKGSYRRAQRVAALTSPPLSAFGSMILATSYNTGANALLCLLAVHQGATDCEAGLKAIRALINRAKLVSDDVVLADGEGAYPASVTPAQMVDWLRYTQTQPWGAALRAGLPILGKTGTLAAVGLGSPAVGKIAAKTGTIAAADPATGRGLFNVQSLAGFLTTRDGRTLVIDLSMSGGTYPSPLTGLVQSNEDVAAVAAAFQQALSH